MKLITVKFHEKYFEPSNAMDVFKPIARVLFDNSAHIDASTVNDRFLFSACNQTTKLVCLYNIRSKPEFDFLYNKLKEADTLKVDKQCKEPFTISPIIILFIDFEVSDKIFEPILSLNI